MGKRPGTQGELRVLEAYYLERGANWPGWEELLPGRTVAAIRCQASKLSFATRPNRADVRARKAILDMGEGYTPEQIDARHGWEHGTAKKALARAWGKR